MASATSFPMTRQGVRDLDNPVQPHSGQADHSGVNAAGVNVGRTERGVSGVGGAVLAGYGLSRGGLFGLALAALGGALVYRGATGHCHAYAAAGMNTAR